MFGEFLGSSFSSWGCKQRWQGKMYPVGKSIRIYVYGLGIVHLFEGQILQMSGGNKTFVDVSSSWSVILANIYIYIIWVVVRNIFLTTTWGSDPI